MTTGALPEKPAADIIRRAAELLDVSPETPKPAVRAAFFRRLREADFLPALVLPHAYGLLSGQASYNPIHWAGDPSVVAEEERLREEVETFAAHFFTLPVEERRRRWQELVAKCAGTPRVAARIESLKPGLAIELDKVKDKNPRVKELAANLLELSVLRPAERAMRRQEWLNSLQSHMREAERAARRLQRRYPKIAALEPALLDKLATWRATQRRIAKLRRPRWKPAGFIKPLFQDVNKHPRLLVAVVVIILSVIGGLSRFTSNSHPPSSSPDLFQVPRNYRVTVPAAENAPIPDHEQFLKDLRNAKTPEERDRILKRGWEGQSRATEPRLGPSQGTESSRP